MNYTWYRFLKTINQLKQTNTFESQSMAPREVSPKKLVCVF